MDTFNRKLSCINVIIMLLFSIASSHNYPRPSSHMNKDWFLSGQEELKETLRITSNTNVAKNVILFVGDGMSLNTVWSGRIYTGQYKFGQSGEEYELEFEKFPNIALAKTYNVDQQISDSAGTATAYLCGVKANAGTVGVNQNVARSNCSNQEENKVTSILDWSMQAGKATGIVTTARITHASPAAAYAHSAERDWESDALWNKTHAGVPPSYNAPFNCKDVALQLVEDNANINVLLGGGRRNFRPSNTTDEEYPSSMNHRLDGRDLIEVSTDHKQWPEVGGLFKEWTTEKNNRNAASAYVWNKDDFDAVDPETTDYLLGLFEPSHMQYEHFRDRTKEPSLAEMTRKAIQILSKDEDGFFLFVEGARIDHAHHDGKARLALEDLYAMDQAVTVVLEMTDEDDTLVIVTSDHSHAFASSGYTSRGLDILGFADNWDIEPPLDDLPFTTLAYTNGPGALINQPRENLTGVDTRDADYKQQAVVPMKYETHGGEDVPIYASGPMAHLFRNVHEQNFIAHVMAYASCVGENQEHCDMVPPNRAGQPGISLILAILLLLLKVFILSSC